MALKLLMPIKTFTVDNFRVEIFQVDPKSPQCFVGNIEFPKKGKLNASWTNGGVCNNKPGKYDLDLEAPELINAIGIANNMKNK